MRRSVITLLAGAVASWALLLACSRAVVVGLALDPWMFTFLQLASGGVFLLLVSTGASVGLAALKRFDTWLIGVLRVGTGALLMAALVHVNVFQAGFFGAINVPISTLGVLLLFNRRPRASEIWGHLLLITGALAITLDLERDTALRAIVLLVLSQLCVIGSSLLAERHPHMSALSLRTRLRLTGIVLVVTALGFAAWRWLQAILGLTEASSAATLDGLARPELWLAGLGLGVTLRGLSTYLGFRATSLAGTQNYMAAVIALPVVGIAFEYAIGWVGLGQWPALGGFDLLGGVLVLSGGLGIVYTRSRARPVRGSA